jgi:predicted alpha/beta hydrolase family esterase
MAASLLILPGINDSGPEHWQSRWERAIPRARRVRQDDWDHPVRAAWVAALARELEGARGDVVLVAHSLGCLLVAHAASARVLTKAVRGALLVAPPDPDAPSFPTVATGFRPLPLDRLQFPTILLASQNDPYASLEFSRRAAAAWGSRLVDLGACGHINAASCLEDWPSGRKWLDTLLVEAGGDPGAQVL